jgi:hypothetical protein
MTIAALLRPIFSGADLAQVPNRGGKQEITAPSTRPCSIAAIAR